MAVFALFIKTIDGISCFAILKYFEIAIEKRMLN